MLGLFGFIKKCFEISIKLLMCDADASQEISEDLQSTIVDLRIAVNGYSHITQFRYSSVHI